MAESTTLLPDSELSTSMQGFHCDTLELRVLFQPGDMNVDAFVEAVTERGILSEPDEDGDREVLLIFAGDTHLTDQYHSHLTVRIWKDGSGSLHLGYYPDESEKALDAPPNVDDCAQWVGQFFTADVVGHIHINYTFDKAFTPAISLNFPLNTSDKALAGTIVSGLALIFPSAPDVTAIIQSGQAGETHLFIRKTTIRLDLKAFHLIGELESTLNLVNSLVKKPE